MKTQERARKNSEQSYHHEELNKEIMRYMLRASE